MINLLWWISVLSRMLFSNSFVSVVVNVDCYEYENIEICILHFFFRDFIFDVALQIFVKHNNQSFVVSWNIVRIFFKILNIIDCRCFLRQVLNHFDKSSCLVRYIIDFSYDYFKSVEYVKDFLDVFVVM